MTIHAFYLPGSRYPHVCCFMLLFDVLKSLLIGWCVQFWCSSLWNVHRGITRAWKARSANRDGREPQTSSPHTEMSPIRSRGETKYGRDYPGTWKTSLMACHGYIVILNLHACKCDYRSPVCIVGTGSLFQLTQWYFFQITVQWQIKWAFCLGKWPSSVYWVNDQSSLYCWNEVSFAAYTMVMFWSNYTLAN